MNGEVVLHLLGRDRRIQGGPFDDWRPPAIGLCLEMRSSQAALAPLTLPIADFHAPTQPVLIAGLVALLNAMQAQPDLPAYIGCRAGIGRTGMMIAALAKLAGQPDPIGWVRAQYHPEAVETADQRAAVEALNTAAVLAALASANGSTKA